jgi:Transcriptional regulator containing an amidase domain and an AraC-type DNA-binding HTH domain
MDARTRTLLLLLATLVPLFVVTSGARAQKPQPVYVCPMEEHTREFSEPGFRPLDGMELVDKNARLRIAVLIHEGVEEIDYAGPLEVFGQSGAITFTVAPTTAVLHSAFGLQVQPDFDFAHAPEADVLFVPGGGIGAVLKDEKILEWIRQKSIRTRYVMSVCNAAFILAKAGLLDGLSATTTATGIPQLAVVAPKTRVVRDRRFVDNGKVITTGGLSAGIDGALHLIDREFGRARAEGIARDIEYNWQPDGHWARGTLADLRMPEVLPLDVSWKKLTDHGDSLKWEVTGRLGTSMTAEEFSSTTARRGLYSRNGSSETVQRDDEAS